MLRVGLTGGLASGKSTVAKLLAAHGAHVLEADAIGRALMLRSDGPLRDAIVSHFGESVLRADKALDTGVLARIAFTDGRVEELNAIVHPAVLARQGEMLDAIFAEDPAAIVVLESALIFETKHGLTKHGETKLGETKHGETKHGGPQAGRDRFDCIVTVIAPEDVRIDRYVQRMTERGLERGASREAHAREAEKRMAHQLSDGEKLAMSDYVLRNNGSLSELDAQVETLWQELAARAAAWKR